MVDNIINEDADKNNAHEQNDVTSSSSIGTISSDQINKQSSLEPKQNDAMKEMEPEHNNESISSYAKENQSSKTSSKD